MLKSILELPGIEKLNRDKLKSINGAAWGGCDVGGECWWERGHYVCCPGPPDQ